MNNTEEIEVIAESPCVDNCKLDEKGVCLGCSLSAEEVNAWSRASNKERQAFLKNAYLRQKAAAEQGK